MAKKLIRWPPSGKLLGAGGGLKAYEGEGAPPLECCCPGDVATCCCPDDPLPTTLKWTFGNDGTGVYADLNNVEVTLVFNAAISAVCPLDPTFIWEAASTPLYNGGTCSFDVFRFRCLCAGCDIPLGSWSHDLNSPEGTPCQGDLGAPTSVTCNPFSAVGVIFNADTLDTISYEVTFF